MSIGFLHGLRTTKRNNKLTVSAFEQECHELRLKGHSPYAVKQIMNKGDKNND